MVSEKEAITTQSKPLEIHLVGIGIGHSISPPIHNFVCKSLGLPWTFTKPSVQASRTAYDCFALRSSLAAL